MRIEDELALIDEFQRSATAKRLKAQQVSEEDDRKLDEHRRKDAEQKEEKHFAEEVAATTKELAEFHERLDRYDEGVVAALLDNRHKLDHAEDDLAGIRNRAATLPDGRRVYRTMDGQRVFDDAGNSVGPDVIDPNAISPGTPTWEQRQAAGKTVSDLNAKRDELLSYQQRVDQARERVEHDHLSQAELQALGNDLNRNMPEAVRQQLGGKMPDANADGPNSLDLDLGEPIGAVTPGSTNNDGPPTQWTPLLSPWGEEVCNAEDEAGVFFRVQAGDGGAAGGERATADAGGDGGGDIAVDAAELAEGDPRRPGAIEGGDASGIATAVAG